MIEKRDHWREAAACRGKPHTIFFPPTAVGLAITQAGWNDAKAICATCTVTEQCLELVLAFPDTDDKWGMYGGKTPAERRVIRDQRHGVR